MEYIFLTKTLLPHMIPIRIATLLTHIVPGILLLKIRISKAPRKFVECLLWADHRVGGISISWFCRNKELCAQRLTPHGL